MNPITKFFKGLWTNAKQKAGLVGIDALARIFNTGEWGSHKFLKTYEKSLYVYACVSKIAEKVSSTRFQLFQILNSKGDIKELIVHPVLDLINKPNPFQTKTQFLQTTIINRKLTGNAFWFLVRGDNGKVKELWNLRPDKMTIVSDPVNFIKAYKFTKNDGSVEIFEPKDIVHFKYPSPLDPYMGLSPIKPAAIRIDVEEFATTYQRDFFINNARPDAVLEVADNMSADQKEEAKEGWEDTHRGKGKNSKIAVLEGGIKYQQVSLSQREMDYIESMRFTRDDILVAFKVPKPIVAITDDVNRANAETAMYIFLSETIKPELESLTEVLNEMLIYPEFGEQFFLDFPDPTPENREAKLLEYDNALKNGWMVINEVRERENMKPMRGGNTLYMGLGMVPVGGIGSAPVDDETEPPVDEDQEEEKALQKQRVFQGKSRLYGKMVLADSIVAKVLAKLKKDKKAKAKKQKIEPAEAEDIQPVSKLRSLIPDPEMKTAYYNLINKRVDARSKTLEKAVLDETNKQMKRVQANLEDVVKSLKKFYFTDHADDAEFLAKKENTPIEKLKASDLMDIKKENKVMAQLVLPFITQYLNDSGEESMSLVAPAEDFVMTEALKKSLEKRAKEFAVSVNNTTLEKLTATLAEGLGAGEGIAEMSARVSNVYEEFPTYRADRIARTEATAANNEGSVAAYKQSGVANAKEWVATKDSRTREEHLDLDGEIVGVDKTFKNGLPYPQEPNCRCVIAPAFIEQ